MGMGKGKGLRRAFVEFVEFGSKGREDEVRLVVVFTLDGCRMDLVF